MALLSIACEQGPSQNTVPVSGDEQAEQLQSPRSIAEETDVLHCSWDNSRIPMSNGESFNRKPAQPNWGIGFLVERRSQSDPSSRNIAVSNPGDEWLNRLCLPLYNSAQGKQWGVLTGKLVVDLSGSTAQFLEFEPNMVQTSYETYAFIVLQETPEGWFQIQYAHPEGDRDGTAWVRKDHFQQQYPPVVQYWKDLFQPVDTAQKSNRGYLYKREQLSPSISLKSPPSASSPTLFTLQSDLSGRDYGIEPLEIQGNWMRVRISIPRDFCGTEETFKFHEGWIPWWSATVGPTLYYPPRGC
ncbi:hypothetical protein [Acaryochloris marina]|uniref:Uncharacterized protein n=1 Tax=Acaryochloris marina (strain MBIC 11017) TaxID=329726 RepID=B0CDN9_ACAM1|nr:hypothetical protein [Acaryochloris marina]ABW28108.1 hypothetical protein AM1_3112 [Acaryochloris marina MBIC11017]BDM77145.1 hypothetical protein AM10699_00190 [Acaryochloris marina MBIC10699]